MLDISSSPEQVQGQSVLKPANLLIHETFQETVQGEGHHSGLPVDFIRLGGCSVGCSWCDTGYGDGAVPSMLGRRSIESLISELKSHHCVVSGGEPFHQLGLIDLVEAIEESGRVCHIETSGARWLDISDHAWVTLSPKSHLGKPLDDRFWARTNEIKIVISSISDFNYYDTRGLLDKKPCSIFLQPEWSNREKTIPLVLEILKTSTRNLKLSLQMHKMIGVQ